MEQAIKIKPDIYYVGSLDRTRKHFDSFYPVKKGTSYNSYLIIGKEKTALIDTIDPSKKDDLLSKLESLGIKKIDYIISNHSEQDHSGSIPFVLEKYPMAKIVTNSKGKDFLSDLLGIKENLFIVVENRKTLDLGGRTLTFLSFPWAHWPETMMTYLNEEKMLFSCDMFGSHYASDDLFYDHDELYEYVEQYYAEIMMPFRNVISKNFDILKGFDIEMILPSHGPIHKNPKKIISLYEKYLSDNVENEVTIIYLSMHGSTEVAVEFLSQKLKENNIKVNLVDVSGMNISGLLRAIISPLTVILATPTVMGNPHPAMQLVSIILKEYRPKLKNMAFLAMYEWGTRAIEMMGATCSYLGKTNLGSLKIKGYPKNTDFAKLENLAYSVINNHKEYFKR